MSTARTVLLSSVAVVSATVDLEVLARVGLALADQNRRRILVALIDGSAYPSDLADHFGLTRANVSNHLACLRGCGLVIAQPEGRRCPLRTRRPPTRPSAARPARTRARAQSSGLSRRGRRRVLLMDVRPERRVIESTCDTRAARREASRHSRSRLTSSSASRAAFGCSSPPRSRTTSSKRSLPSRPELLRARQRSSGSASTR